jgi:PAS domain S-box-containing protein
MAAACVPDDRAQQLAALVDALPEGLVLLDRSGRLLHANPAAGVLLGHPPAALTGMALTALARAGGEELDDLLRRGARSRQLVPGALWLAAADGGAEARLRCDVALVRARDGQRPALLAMRLRPHGQATDRFVELNRRIEELTREVERRRAAERRLEEQREWMRVTLRSIGDAVITTDVAGLVSFMNPTAEALTGWAEADAAGRPVEEVVALVKAATRQPIASPVRGAIAARAPVDVPSHALLRARDGGHLPVDDVAAPIVDDNGTLLGAVMILRDMSERLAADGRRRSLESQLREMQKTQALGRLAGGIAHDFNNVLGSIIGNTVLAQHEIAAGLEAGERIAQIDAAARRARRLVRQILAFTRRSPQRVQRQALDTLVTEVLDLLRSTVPTVVTIEAQLPELPLHVEADATQLHQVLMNLCTNAWHALRGGTGHIELLLEALDLSAGVPAELHLPPGHYARIAVRDSGCGMDEATRRRMFEPFFTTKPVNEGTGLGLAVVQGIVAEHHGAITVDSAPGRGTTVSIYLPQATEASATESSAAAPAAVVRGAGEHVLYVDDDEMMAVTAEALLSRAGYRVTVFHDPPAALAAAQADPDTYDLAITDFNMPGMNGLDLAWALRRLRADLPIVITSGYVPDDLRLQVRRIGHCRLLNKENLADEVGSVVAALLQARDAEAEAEAEAEPRRGAA